jgi:hypothetical protein
MNQTGNNVDVVEKAISLAKEAEQFRAVAIEQLLAQQTLIQQHLAALGYTDKNNSNGHSAISNGNGTPSSRRFRGMTLVAVAKILLEENKELHGKKIEEMAKAGGFKANAKNFQGYLPIAFARAGGFENVGKNTWKLNPGVQPVRQKRP